jgi:hypothetical protein
MPNLSIFKEPEGNPREIRFLQLLNEKRIAEAAIHLLKNIKRMKVNTEIGGLSLFNHAIIAFENCRSVKSCQIYRSLLTVMINNGARLNDYNKDYQATLFTILCNCPINQKLLDLMLLKGAWVNPEDKLTDKTFVKTPLGEIATNFNTAMTHTLLKSGANPSSKVLTNQSAFDDILDYLLVVAAEQDYFESAELTINVAQVISLLVKSGVGLRQEHLTFMQAESSDKGYNQELKQLITYLEQNILTPKLCK